MVLDRLLFHFSRACLGFLSYVLVRQRSSLPALAGDSQMAGGSSFRGRPLTCWVQELFRLSLCNLESGICHANARYSVHESCPPHVGGLFKFSGFSY